MWHSIRSGRYGIDLPGVIAVVASIVLHQYWASLIIVVILVINEQLKNIIIARVHKKQNKLLDQLPTSVHVIRKHKIVDIQINDIRIGEEIEIRPGEVIPLDGVILKGSGDFRELNITGEGKLQHHEVGETISSGTTNLNETITAKVLRTAKESQYRQLIRIERTAVNSTAPFALQADRYSVIFMLGSYIIATAAWLISGQPLRFLEVIIIVTPAPFTLAPMLALTKGLNLASKNGIYIKTNLIFERFAHAKTFGFDKTDTLANKVAEIDAVNTFKPYTKSEMETYAASMLQRSNHFLAQAIKNVAINNKLKLQKTKHIKELAGYGAEARIGNKQVIIGNYSLIKERGINVPKFLKLNTVAQTAMFIGIDGSLIGYITFKDSYRSDIKPMLKSLKQLGAIKTLLVTDESQSIAVRVAKLLGITDVKANVQPSDKLLAIEAVEDRPLVFIGNGLNDAPVLTAADVGIAFGVRGSTVASEAADIVIMQDDLNYVAFAMAIARAAFKVTWRAIAIAVGLSLVLLLVLATGKVQPIEATFIRIGIEVMVLGFIYFQRAPNAPR
jgi:heavy metal translocating P-type ATPase